MNKKKICLLIGAVLIIILIILLRPRHIKVSLSDTDDLSVVREGSEISLTQDEKNQLIDIIEDITVRNKLKDLTDALAFTPSHPVTFYNDADSYVQYVLNIQYKDGSSEELSIVKCPTILYKNQYLSVDLYALELIQEEVDN